VVKRASPTHELSPDAPTRASPRPRARRTALGVRAPRLLRRRASQGPLKSSPLLALCAGRTPRPTGRTDRRRTGGHHGVPPYRARRPRPWASCRLDDRGRARRSLPYLTTSPARGGPVPHCTPSIPWARAGEASIPRSSGETS
jgi:hypothetical protein